MQETMIDYTVNQSKFVVITDFERGGEREREVIDEQMKWARQQEVNNWKSVISLVYIVLYLVCGPLCARADSLRTL